jgi:predicted glutamine amidotransferase
MCELALVNLKDPVLNSIFMTTQLQVDAMAGNRDGTGVFSVGEQDSFIWKTELDATDVLDLGFRIRDCTAGSIYPLMGHARWASKGIKVDPKNSHPFIGKRFVLAHNGTLYGKDEEVDRYAVSTDTNRASDSLKFLETLEKTAKEFPDIPFIEIFQKSMDMYKGKFAFIIYDYTLDKHYVIRGDSADLHVVFFYDGVEKTSKSLGYAVNTKKDSLIRSAGFSTPIMQAASNSQIFHGDIIELDKETVYEATGEGLVKIGTVKENVITYKSYTTTSYGKNQDWFSWGGGANSGLEIDERIPEWKYSKRIYTYMVANFLTHRDIDALFFIFLGVRVSDCDIHHLTTFATDVIPLISAPKKIRHKLAALIGKGGRLLPHHYADIKDFEYPWMLNSPEKIKEMISKIAALKAKG